MFTGIIESTGIVTAISKVKQETGNLLFQIQATLASELKPGQSISHNGVCLTVTTVKGKTYSVTAIKETLKKSNLGSLKTGDLINLERTLLANGRFDGHIVQGHVDQIAWIKKITNQGGSHLFKIGYRSTSKRKLIVEKGSVCLNGVSLTVVKCGKNFFSVAIIPYTFRNTNFHLLKKGSTVNLEFDIIGKYLSGK